MSIVLCVQDVPNDAKVQREWLFENKNGWKNVGRRTLTLCPQECHMLDVQNWVLDSESGNRFWEFMLKMKIGWNWLEKKNLETPMSENFRILILIHLPEVDLLKTLLNDEFPSRQNQKKTLENWLPGSL